MLALLEVMDKELPLQIVLAWTFIPSSLAFLAAWKRPWLLWIIAPISALFSFGQISELLDPFVGPAMRAEAGLSYLCLSWSSPFILATAIAVGFSLRRSPRMSR